MYQLDNINTGPPGYMGGLPTRTDLLEQNNFVSTGKVF